MALPQFSMRELIEAGVHFGHKTKRWNPKMAPYLFGVRNDVHIINLQHTVPLLHTALQAIRDTVAKNGRVLFVGTKRQASDPVMEAAKRCGQHYINQRWLGGMLTNWQTIRASINRLRKLEEQLGEGEESGFTKKEVLTMQREFEKLDKSLGGIKDMGGLPDLIIVIDTNKEDIAVKESAKLGIPIVAVLDSNSSPDGITYPVPGNDDATRAIRLYCQLFSDAALDGIQESLAASGIDFGASEELVTEENIEAFAEKEEKVSGKGSKKGPTTVVKKSRAVKDQAKEAEEDITEGSEDIQIASADAGQEKEEKTGKQPTARKAVTKKKAS